MQSFYKEILIGDPDLWKSKALAALRQSSYAVFLDGHHHTDPYGEYDWVAAGGLVKTYKGQIQELQDAWRNQKTWFFGILSYDAKCQMEAHWVNHLPSLQQTPELIFFEPEWVMTSAGGKVELQWKEGVLRPEFDHLFQPEIKGDSISMQQTLSKEEYLDGAHRLLNHIKRGDIYEVNYCLQWKGQGFYDPLSVWMDLNKKMQAPFSGYFRVDHLHLLSMSPERYLAKKGRDVISQPIKGTAKRGETTEDDQQLVHDLYHSEKERGENVMIVDLVRNDLSRIAVKGTVDVPELFGIHSFNTVHQMISTVHCQVDQADIFDVFQATFPMGSMTGAPKHSAIKLIEESEKYARGWYSGSLGYITPDGDADFNVIIRSLVYDSQLGLSTLGVGSALTFLANPEDEYEECLLKAKAIRESL